MGGLPFSLKVLLENLLRNEDGRRGHGRADIGGVRPLDRRDRGPGDRLLARPGADAGLHRGPGDRRPGRDARRQATAGGRPDPDQPARPGRSGDRPLGGGRHRRAATPRPQRGAGVRAQPGALHVPALGARRPSPTSSVVPPQYRHRPPDQLRVPGPGGAPTTRASAYPDTLVGTNSHTPMVNGLGVLGWGVGGIEAEAAMLGQPISMLTPEVVGFRLSGELPEGTHRHRPGPDRDRAAARPRGGGQVRRVLRPRGRQRAGRGPGHHRQHVARVRVDLRHLPDRRRDPPVSQRHRAPARAGRPGRGVRQGAGPVARPGGRAPRSPRRSSSTSARSCPAWPAPPAPGPAHPDRRPPRLPGRPGRHGPRGRGLDRPEGRGGPDEASAESFPASDPPAAMAGTAPTRTTTRKPAGWFEPDPTGASGRDINRVPVALEDGTPSTSTTGVVIAAITSCTNTSNPSVMLGRRAAGPQRGPARPGRQAVRSRPAWPPAPGWSWTTPSGPTCCRTSRRCASTWSASAAPPASATAGWARQRGLYEAVAKPTWSRWPGAQREPQLRGPHPPPGAGPVPGLAPPGGGLRPGRDGGHRPARRADRPRPRRPARLPARHVAVAAPRWAR